MLLFGEINLEENIMSLKKGDLVEIIGCRNPSLNKFIGKRFILNVSTLVKMGDSYVRGWRSPFETRTLIFSPAEKYLRKVNPDGDELSSESFESLMLKLKTANKNHEKV